MNEAGLTDNVHFPKVYKSGKITDRRGKHLDTYQIERLIPHSSVSAQEIFACASAIFDEKKVDENGFRLSEHGDISGIISGLAVHEHDELAEAVTSESLMEAIAGIRHCIQKGRRQFDRSVSVFADLHSDNLMYRRTPHGLQLVFSDPIAIVHH